MITYEQIDLTPELAAELLAQLPEHQRKVTRLHVVRLARAMAAGEYMLNPQPLIIDSTGALMDGQHRCAAVVESGVTIPVVIARGADPTVFSLVDTGKIRQASQFIPGPAGTVIAAAARAVLSQRLPVFKTQGSRGTGLTAGRSLITNKEILEEVHGDPEYEAVAPQILAIRRAARITPVPLLAVHILASRNVDPDKASLWLSGLETGEDLAKGDPRLALRNRWVQDNGHQIRGAAQQWVLTVKCWNAWVAGGEIRQLRYRAVEGLPAITGADLVDRSKAA
jgi:hypothetical protein